MEISKIIVDRIAKILPATVMASFPESEKTQRVFSEVRLLIANTSDSESARRIYTQLKDVQAQIPGNPLEEANYSGLLDIVKLAEEKLASTLIDPSLIAILNSLADDPVLFEEKAPVLEQGTTQMSLENRLATQKEIEDFFHYTAQNLSTLPKCSYFYENFHSLVLMVLKMHRGAPEIDLSSLFSCQAMINLIAESKSFPLTIGQCVGSSLLEILLKNSKGKTDTPLPKVSAESLRTYLSCMESDSNLEGLFDTQLMDLIDTADYLGNEPLIERCISKFKTKVDSFSHDTCVGWICKLAKMNRASFPMSKIERVLMEHWNSFNKNRTDEEILNNLNQLYIKLESNTNHINALILSETSTSLSTIIRAFELFPNLKELDIEFCSAISDIDIETLKNRDLEKLNLEKLNISGTELSAIPEGIWPKLKELRAEDCQKLTSIAALKDSNLEKLDISGTAVSAIPKGRWPKLKELRALRCQNLIIAALKDSNLEKLNISGTELSAIPKGRWPKLKELLAIDCRNLTNIAALKDSNLEKLDISYTNLIIIPEGKWPKLKALIARNCKSLANIEGLRNTEVERMDLEGTPAKVAQESDNEKFLGVSYWKKLRIINDLPYQR